MVEAARIVEQARPDILDINFGCPVKRVAGKGAGAGMLQKYPQNAGDNPCRGRCRKDSRHRKNPSRLGCRHKIIVDLAEQLQDCGIAAPYHHGRTRAQMVYGRGGLDSDR